MEYKKIKCFLTKNDDDEYLLIGDGDKHISISLNSDSPDNISSLFELLFDENLTSENKIKLDNLDIDYKKINDGSFYIDAAKQLIEDLNKQLKSTEKKFEEMKRINDEINYLKKQIGI